MPNCKAILNRSELLKISADIPINHQHARAIGGIDIRYLSGELPTGYETSEHRDDYYILAIPMQGHSVLRCDMADFQLDPGILVLIKPLQVHVASVIDRNSEGWILTIAPFLVPAHCAAIFQDLAIEAQCISISASQQQSLTDTAALLHAAFAEASPCQPYILKGLLDALINRAAGLLLTQEAPPLHPQNQSQILTAHFRKLLAEQSVQRAPAYFAKKLHVTTAHLNDCIKSTTGFPLTYWLQQTLVLEAKRQLYYTDKSIQQIAYDLDFSDPAYFSRLFHKVSGQTPLTFRRKFRE
jgi:AraC family transcriptional activator of pobA